MKTQYIKKGIIFSIISIASLAATLAVPLNISQYSNNFDPKAQNENMNIQSVEFGTHSASVIYEDANKVEHLYSAGRNNNGQLGLGDTITDVDGNEIDENKVLKTYEEVDVNGDSKLGVNGNIKNLQREEYMAGAIIDDGEENFWIWGYSALPANVNYRYNDPSFTETADKDKFGNPVIKYEKGWVYATNKSANTKFSSPVEVDLNDDDHYGAQSGTSHFDLGIGSFTAWDSYVNQEYELFTSWGELGTALGAPSGGKVNFILPEQEKNNWDILDVSIAHKTGLAIAYSHNDNKTHLFGFGENHVGMLGNEQTTGIKLDEVIGLSENTVDSWKELDSKSEIELKSQDFEIASYDEVALAETASLVSVTDTDGWSHVLSFGSNNDGVDEQGFLGASGNGVEGGAINEVKLFPHKNDDDHANILDKGYEHFKTTQLTASKANIGLLIEDEWGYNHIFVWGNNRSKQLTDQAGSINGVGGPSSSSKPQDLDTNGDGVWGTKKKLFNFSMNDGASVSYYDEEIDRVQTYVWGEAMSLGVDKTKNGLLDYYSKPFLAYVADSSGAAVYGKNHKLVSATNPDKPTTLVGKANMVIDSSTLTPAGFQFNVESDVKVNTDKLQVFAKANGILEQLNVVKYEDSTKTGKSSERFVISGMDPNKTYSDFLVDVVGDQDANSIVDAAPPATIADESGSEIESMTGGELTFVPLPDVNDGNGISIGTIIGISIASILILGLIIGLIIWLVLRNKKKKQ